MAGENPTEQCFACKKDLPTHAFYMYSDPKTGERRCRARCKVCHGQKYCKDAGYDPPSARLKREATARRRAARKKRCKSCGESKSKDCFQMTRGGTRLRDSCVGCERFFYASEDERKEAKRATKRRRTKEYRQELRRRAAERKGRAYRAKTVRLTPEQVRRALVKDQGRCLTLARTIWRRRPKWLSETISEHRYRLIELPRSRAQFLKAYRENPEAQRLRVKRYKHANPDKVQKWGDKRWKRAAEQADGTLTKQAVGDLLAKAKRCAYCTTKLNADSATIDHMIPLKLGGLHSRSNVVACCLSCNSRKGARPYSEWVDLLSPKMSQRAVALYRRRHGELDQGSLMLRWTA